MATVTSVRTALIVGCTTWFATQLVLALLALGSTRSPFLTVVAMLLGAAVVTSGVRLLLAAGHGPSPRLEAALLAVSVPVIQALSLLPLEPTAVTGYANWAGSALGLVIAGLVARGHLSLAAMSSLAQALVIGGWYVAVPGPVSAATGLLALSPVAMWLAIAWGVRVLLQRSGELTAGFLGRLVDGAGVDDDEERDWTRLRESWQRRMDREISPLLRAVSTSDKVAPELRAWSGLLSQSLRDSLRARVLLTDETAEAITAARARGVQVQVHCDVPPGTHLEAVRQSARLLVRLLELPGVTAVLLHLSNDPLALTATLDAPVSAEQLAALWGADGTGWRLDVIPVDNEVVVRGTPLAAVVHR